MQINIIHIAKRTDRWKLLQKELLDENISDYRIWYGIDDPVTPHKGISKSHKQIVGYAKDNFLPEVLIAEDDMHFTGKGAFQFFLSKKPADFDLYLVSIYFGMLRKDETVEGFSGLTFYIIREKFYNKFLSTPERAHLDCELRSKGKFSVCNPFTVIQHNGFSDNKNQYCNYDGYLRNRKLFS